ncbi:MAG: hypothetical protein AUG09_03465 [Acidobacteria bacterium 13_1_20CM_2_68_7]|nr:MAG: hypothetical protein AUG09_03465 [Acidobacteria bacterium 13_1_20CM_2_68_7]
MPKPFLYKKHERILAEVLIVDDHDAGHPVVSIGGYHVAIPREHLDHADTRTSGRDETDEERDRRQLREHEDRAARERAEAELRQQAAETQAP